MNQKTKIRRQKSLEDQQSDEFLNKALRQVKPRLLVAWGLELVLVFVLIVQMATLAWFFGQVLLDAVNHTVSSAQAFWQSLPILMACLLLRPVLYFCKEKLLSDAGLIMASKARHELIDALGGLLSARSQFGADGAIAQFATDTPDELLGYARFYVQKLTAISTPIMIAIMIAIKSPTSALVLLATTPLVPLLMAIIGIKTAQKSREQMHALAALGGSFLDWIRGMNTLKRLLALEHAKIDIEQSAHEYKKRTMSVLKIAFLNSASLELLSSLAIAIVAVYLGFGLMGMLPWASGRQIISYDNALFILLLVPEFYAPLRRLGAEYHAKAQAQAAAKILTPIINSPPNQKPMANPDTTTKIILQNVCVKTAGRMRVCGVSFCVEPLQKVMLMGRSGSGKSTIFEVILGVCEFEGQVIVNAKQFGYLPQTPSLLPLSIAQNLRLANPTASDDQLKAVLEQVGLWELIGYLPLGMDTQLSEQGGGLSGGQAQRLAIAQLILQDADVWLLDEPTEHLDAQTKVDIHELLHSVCQQKTVLWASHDSPPAWIDDVVTLEDIALEDIALGDSHDTQ